MTNQSSKNLQIFMGFPPLNEVHSPGYPGCHQKQSRVDQFQPGPGLVEALLEERHPVIQVGHLALGLVQIAGDDLEGFGVGETHQ